MLSSDETGHELTLWKAVFDSMQAGIIIYDVAGKLLYVNAAGLRILGVDEADSVPEIEVVHDTKRLYAPDRSELPLEQWPLLRVLRGETVVDEEITIRDLATGAELVHTYSGSLVRDQTSKPVWALISFRDITAEKHDQASREHLLSELETVIAAIPDGLIIHGSQGEITRINPAAEAILGYSSDQMAEPVSSRLAHIMALDGDGRPIPYQQMPSPRALRGETVRDMILKWPSELGCTEISANGAPMIDRNGVLLGAVMTLRDVTDERRLERDMILLLGRLRAALETSEQMRSGWKALFESITDGIIVSEGEYENVEANASALRIVGVDSPESLGRLFRETPEWRNIYTEDGTLVPDAERPWRKVVNGGSVVDYPCRYVNHLGQSFDLLVSGNCVNPVAGGRVRYLQVLRDVTALRKLERAKDEFLLVVSHELRNPLQVIKGLAQLFKLKLDALHVREKLEKHLDMMDSQIGQVTHLVDDILMAYRLSAGRFSTDLKPVDLLQVIADAAAPIMLSSPTHPVNVTLPDDEPVMVMADTQRLQEILANLLSNAIKYSPQGGKVQITAECESETVTVCVDDEGIGIPHEHLERIFDGFHRVGNAAGRTAGGLGLGLYISRRLARLHGGDLWAENRPVCGTRMCLRLPRRKEAPNV